MKPYEVVTAFMHGAALVLPGGLITPTSPAELGHLLAHGFIREVEGAQEAAEAAPPSSPTTTDHLAQQPARGKGKR